jgi:MFS family permease
VSDSADSADSAGHDELVLRSARGRWVLVATVLGSAIASIDATVVSVALPTIGRDFGTGFAALQWVVTAYSLALSGLLLIAGALGDKYGRKKVFLTGVVWFAAASILSAIAPSAGALIAFRGLQGVGAALLTPGSLAILQATFRADDRGRAIGAWAGFSGLGTAIGPFIGGWLVSVSSWRLIFLINLPIAAIVVAVAWRHVPESRDRRATAPIDVIGGTLATTGLLGLTFGLIEGPSGGWSSAPVLAALLVGIALLIGFVGWERRTATPMLPLGLFSSTQFSATNIVTFIVYGAIGGTLFLLPINLQNVSGYSPLKSGVALLPATVITLVLIGIGLALFILTRKSGNYPTEVLPGVLVFGLGLAVTVAPLTSTALASAPTKNADIASAVNNDVARAAGLIAVALLPAAGGIHGTDYRNSTLLSSGFHVASLIAAGLCLAAGVLAAFTIRNPSKAAQAQVPPQRHPSHCALDAPPPPPRGAAAK